MQVLTPETNELDLYILNISKLYFVLEITIVSICY